MDVSPLQQSIVTGDPGTAQDALHEALASVRTGERTYLIAAGVLYKIGPEPQPVTKTVGHLWWRRTVSYMPIVMFGRGFGGAGWMITWPDGTKQQTSNLWYWGEVDQPDNAVLQAAPFWGNNLLMHGVEHLLQSPPAHMRAIYDRNTFPNGFFAVLDQREDPILTYRREEEAWYARPWWAKVLYADVRPLKRSYEHDASGGYVTVPELRLVQFVRMYGRRLRRTLRGAVNLIVCTKCWHWRKTHWVASDPFGGDIDWGCGYHRKDANGKHHHCDC
jgi:hypothetical protein